MRIYALEKGYRYICSEPSPAVFYFYHMVDKGRYIYYYFIKKHLRI